MIDLTLLLLILCVVTSAIKLSLLSFSRSLIVAALWFLLITVGAPFIARLSPFSFEMLADLPLWHHLLWLEGALMLLYCVSYPTSGVCFRLLRWFPGIMCGVSFYFLLTYSFIKFIDSNFALCGVIVGLLAALSLLLPSAALRRWVSSKAFLVELLFASEILMLLLTSL